MLALVVLQISARIINRREIIQPAETFYGPYGWGGWGGWDGWNNGGGWNWNLGNWGWDGYYGKKIYILQMIFEHWNDLRS